MNKILTLILLLTIANTAFAVSDSCSEFKVKAGILSKGNDDFYFVSRETNVIPMITIENNPDFRFGISIESKTKSNFRFRAIMIIPNTKNLNIDRETKSVLSEGTITVDYPESHAPGEGVLSNYFNNGDSLGDYIFKLIINNEHCATINFKVVDESA